jgi:hypothetical protein
MVETHSLPERTIALLLVGVVTWWVVAPESYIACIRKVPWLWMDAYPLNTKTWFPRHLRFFWLYWYRTRPH